MWKQAKLGTQAEVNKVAKRMASAKMPQFGKSKSDKSTKAAQKRLGAFVKRVKI